MSDEEQDDLTIFGSPQTEYDFTLRHILFFGGSSGPSNGELREDSTFELREDGTFELRE